jgi:drug/metabolite transporter (DMT)-like permease
MRALPDTPATGIALMASAMLFAPAMDILAKLMTETVSPGQTTLARLAAQSVILLPVVLLAREWGRPTLLHAAAGVCLAIALFCIVTAVSVMPVANALAIFFVEPLLLTLLSAWLLGEPVGWRRLAAVAVGLAGAMIVLRPNVAAFGWAAALPLLTALFFALYLVVTRVVSRRGGRVALQFWAGVFAALTLGTLMVLALPAGIEPLAFGPMGGRELLILLGMGLLAALTHQMIAQAFARAEAGALAPLQYLEIFSATILGWLVFADFPDTITWAGTAIIVASGIYVFHRERQLSRRPKGDRVPQTG